MDGMIIDNQNLVHFVCHKYFRSRLAAHEYEDLAAAGMIGLVVAAQTFRPERGVKFSTYACKCIWNEIQCHLRGVYEGGIKIPRAAKIAGLRVPCRSINEIISEDGVTELGDMLISEQDFSSADVAEFIASLGEREGESVILLIDGLSQQQIADRLCISQAQVSRILARVRMKYVNYIREVAV